MFVHGWVAPDGDTGVIPRLEKLTVIIPFAPVRR